MIPEEARGGCHHASAVASIGLLGCEAELTRAGQALRYGGRLATQEMWGPKRCLRL